MRRNKPNGQSSIFDVVIDSNLSLHDPRHQAAREKRLQLSSSTASRRTTTVSSTRQPLRVAVIGAGQISHVHIRAIRRVRNAQIVGICDIDQARAASVARQYGIAKAVSLPEELLAESPDVVHVLTPPEFHVEHALAALNRGCHVYVEKPLATSVEDCDAIASAAQRAGRQVCVGHSLLYDPFVRRALALCRSGAIGRVIGMDHFRSQEYPGYCGGPVPYQFRDGGFPFRDTGVHSLYLLEAFLGDISDVQMTLGPPANDGCPLFKEWRAVVRCAAGSGHVHLSWNVKPLQDLLLVHGTRGTIRADIFGMSVTKRTVTRMPQHAERILNSIREGFGIAAQAVANVGRVATRRLLRYHGLNMLVADFYSAIATDSPSPVTVEQARNVVKWTEQVAALADSARTQHVRRVCRPSTSVLVTGATGFIGQHLLQRLLSNSSNTIRVLTRYAPPEEWLRNKRLEVVMGDLGDPDVVDECVHGVCEVYHLGAAVNGTAEDFQRATISGTRNIVDSAVRHRVSKLIYMSSLSVLNLAAAQDGAVVDETWPLEPRPMERGHYSNAKWAAEQLVRDAVKTRGLRAIILRPGEVIAPGRPFLSGAAAIESRRRFFMFGDGSAPVPVTWMDDLMAAVESVARADHFAGQSLHVVSDTLTQDEVVRRYCAVTGSHKPVIRIPLRLLFVATGVGGVLAQVLGRSSPLSSYRVRSAIGKRQFDCSMSRRFLGLNEPPVIAKVENLAC